MDKTRFLLHPRIRKITSSLVLMVPMLLKRKTFGHCNALTFERCMMAIFHNMVEDFVEMFMDESIFGKSFEVCLQNVDKVLDRCEYTNLVLN